MPDRGKALLLPHSVLQVNSYLNAKKYRVIVTMSYILDLGDVSPNIEGPRCIDTGIAEMFRL